MLKIGIVAPSWGRETTSEQTYVAALARALARRHAVRVLARDDAPPPALDGAARPEAAGDLVIGPALRRTPAPARPRVPVHVPTHLPAHSEPPASDAGLTVERLSAPGFERLPRWIAGAAFARPLVRWALGSSLEALVGWADALIAPDGGEDPVALTAARRARALGLPLALVPCAGAAPTDPRLARAAVALLTATRAGARALLGRGWPGERLAVTGMLPEEAAADVAAFRRRYRVVGPVVLYAGEAGDPGYELLRNGVGLVWHKRPEATFVFVSTARGGRRTTRTSHAGHMLHLAGLDAAERASAFAAASVVCAAGPLPACGGAVAGAWAHARPVVASESAVARELLGDGAAGALSPADAHELAAAALRLLSDPAMAERMGHEGQRRLREQHGAARADALLCERFAELAPAPLPALRSRAPDVPLEVRAR